MHQCYPPILILVAFGWLSGCGAHHHDPAAAPDRADQTDQANQTNQADQEPWLLPIPARQQWTNDHGYCGETSIQVIGLYYGAWLSQSVVRQAGHGELLLGVNADAVLKSLKFAFEDWPKTASPPQFQAFMLWQKRHIAAGEPVVIGSYLQGEADANYDHIIAVTGVVPHSRDLRTYDANDTLVFHNNYAAKPLHRSFGSLAATREGCQQDLAKGGCIPLEFDYGVAITGLVDEDHATVPVSIAVDSSTEANITQGAPSQLLHATATMRGLTAGKHYALLRYDDTELVPTRGKPAAFIASAFVSRQDFTAVASTWTFTDPQAFASDGVLYYRCVPLD